MTKPNTRTTTGTMTRTNDGVPRFFVDRVVAFAIAIVLLAATWVAIQQTGFTGNDGDSGLVPQVVVVSSNPQAAGASPPESNRPQARQTRAS